MSARAAGQARASRGPPGAGRAPGPPRRWSAAVTSGAGPRLPSARALLHVCGHVRRSPTAPPGALRRGRPCGMRPRTPPTPGRFGLVLHSRGPQRIRPARPIAQVCTPATGSSSQPARFTKALMPRVSASTGIYHAARHWDRNRGHNCRATEHSRLNGGEK